MDADVLDRVTALAFGMSDAVVVVVTVDDVIMVGFDIEVVVLDRVTVLGGLVVDLVAVVVIDVVIIVSVDDGIGELLTSMEAFRRRLFYVF